MRLHSFFAVAALLTSSLAAHADTITQTFSQTVSATTFASSGYLENLAGFNPALGTLNSISGALSGTEASPGSNIELILRTDATGEVLSYLESGSTGTSSAGTVSVSGPPITDPRTLLSVTSTGSVPYDFDIQAAGVVNVAILGTVTYNYTPNAAPVAATPEPSSIALLSTGLLGVAGVVRKRFA